MRICVVLLSIACFICVFSGCVNTPRINLGTIPSFTPSSNTQSKEPKVEIARICHSFFGADNYKSYEILSIENLLKQAQKNTQQDSFKNVGIWQKDINILFLWRKKCLILGHD